MKLRIEVFEDRAGEWRIRLKSYPNGKILMSSEGYYSKSSALKTARPLQEQFEVRPEIIIINAVGHRFRDRRYVTKH